MNTGARFTAEDARDAGAERAVATDIETFAAPWPVVLTEMKDFIDLWFLARSTGRQAAALRIFISRALVAQASLQPHAREFKAAVSRVPCRIELKGTNEPAHRIEIDYRR
jgi:hypothetical protein